MQQNEFRSIVTSQFYQSLANSGVEIQSIPQSQLQALVNALADGMLAGLSAAEDEAAPATAAVGIAHEEETPLWQGRPYLSIGIRYELTSQRLRIVRGLLGRNLEEIELVRVRDTAVKQHLGERTLNVGDITVVSNDPLHPEVILHNVKDPMEVREMIRAATVAEKDRRGLHYREEM